MGLLDALRPRCPTCGKRGLRTAQFLRLTVVLDGKRAPAAWYYYRCPACGGRFRQENQDAIHAATDEDWRRVVDRDPADGRAP
jgi:hypothetical protein